jgi:glucosylceramidase
MSFLISPWSPPAFMKTNGEMNNGGELKKEYYRTWAEYFAKFIKAYKEEGIKIRYLTVQNEPAATQTWDSCIYSAEEEGVFVKNYLAPVLKKEGLYDTAIYIWDHNKEAAYDRAKKSFSVAQDDIAGIALHWYTGDHFDSISIIKSMYPGKDVIFTEGCVEYSRFADSGEVQKAEMYAHDIVGNLKAGISASIDWNLLLDSEGGPNHVGNFCAAPMMCSADRTKVEKRLMYYYIGHFSRYIKAGAIQIGITTYTDRIEAVGFLNPDGERVLILLNRNNEPIDITVRENGEGFIKFVINAHTIKTIRY